MRIELIAHSELNNILEAFKREENLKNWMPYLESSEVLHEDDQGWIAFQIMRLPWPFDRKYCQVRYSIRSLDEHEFIVDSELIPLSGQAESQQEYKEMDYFASRWTARILDDDESTKITFETTSQAKPILPRWMQDPIIQKVMIRSFLKLKNHLSTNKIEKG